MGAHLFALEIEASGEVRDKDGNLIETVPVKQTIHVTEEQYNELKRLEAQEAAR